jgi:hypothetical protein
MARPLRIQYPGAIYHVMTRGNGRQLLFREQDDYQRMLDGLERTVDRTGWGVFAFVWMPNHISWKSVRYADFVFDLHQQVSAQSVETQEITDEVLARDDKLTGLFAVRWQLFADDSKEHIVIVRGQQQSPQMSGKALADGVRDNRIDITGVPKIGVDMVALAESEATEQFGCGVQGEHRGVA